MVLAGFTFGDRETSTGLAKLLFLNGFLDKTERLFLWEFEFFISFESAADLSQTVLCELSAFFERVWRSKVAKPTLLKSFYSKCGFLFHGNSEFQVSFDTASDLSQTAFVEGFVFIYRAASSKLPKRALFRLYWSKIDLAYFLNLKFTNFRYFALLRFRKLKNIILLKHHFTEFLRKLKNPEKTSF